MRRSLSAATAVSLAVHGASALGLYWGEPHLREPSAAPTVPATLAGETFELDLASLATDPAPGGADAPSPSAGADRAPDVAPADGVAASHAVPKRGLRRAGAAPSSDGSSGERALYGAVGERSAADFATAFTRAFAQAASADPIWVGAPYGSAGHARVDVTLTEAGAIERWSLSGEPSRALASGVRRTFALVDSRAFTAPRRLVVLDVRARVSRDEVHDGLHGDVFALGATHEREHGSAFFALAIGRRIDVDVRAR